MTRSTVAQLTRKLGLPRDDPLRVRTTVGEKTPSCPVDRRIDRGQRPLPSRMIDRGIRRGRDVLKALALGANAVLAGRPFLYAAAVGNAAAVCHATNLLREEIYRNMALLGLDTLSEISAEYLVQFIECETRR